MTKPLTILLPLLLFICAPNALAQGRIVFDETTHDFGTIEEGVTEPR